MSAITHPQPGRARDAVSLARTLSVAALAGAAGGFVVGGVLGRLGMRLLAVTSPYAHGGLTDDQALESMRVMPNVKTLLADRGVTFDNNFVSYSLCCPSRATYLTGQYAHNLFNVLGVIVDKKAGTLNIDPADEIIKGVMLTRDGAIVHPAFAGA